MRMIAGILQPTEGTIEIGGDDLAEHPIKAKHRLGFIPDRPYVYDKLTGAEFLRFVAALYGQSGEAIERRMDELLELFELTDWKDELVESYSHGMRQKLIISSALLHRPEVIVVDEPMVGLDPKGARFLKDLFRAFVDRGGTVLMSTHTLEIAEAMCDRIGIIQQGKIVACGTMAELRQQTASGDVSLEELFLKLTGGIHERELDAILDRVSTTKPAPVQPTLRTVLRPEVAERTFARLREQKSEGTGKIVLLVLLGLGFWSAVFGVFYRVLRYIHSEQEIGTILAAKLLGVTLLSFASLLLLSNLITALSSFFLAQDLDMLVAAPVDWLRLYLAKLGETLLHSSWMVVLMAVPIFTAYGIVYQGRAALPAGRPGGAGAVLRAALRGWNRGDPRPGQRLPRAPRPRPAEPGRDRRRGRAGAAPPAGPTRAAGASRGNEQPARLSGRPAHSDQSVPARANGPRRPS